MKSYQITSPNFTGSIIISYNDEGLLCKFEINASLNLGNIKWLLHNIPAHIDNVMSITHNSTAQIVSVPQDLSFNAFWNAYNYKIGHKARAEKLWKILPDNQRIAAVTYIQKYNSFLIDHPKQDKLYPETYLSQRRWEL